MSASQYESNSAFNGGGMTFSQSTQGTDSGPSPAKGRDSYGVVPVTVKQISEASHSGDDKSNFVIDGIDVANVTIVGMVTKKNVRNTDVGFTLDDGTGQIDCIRWLNEPFDSSEVEDIHEGTYIRVNGKLKSSQGRRKIAAFSARPVMNFDEVTFHFIECVHFHLQNSKTKLQGEATTMSQSFNSTPNTPASAVSNGYQTAPSTNLSHQLFTDELKGFDQMVVNYLRQHISANGVHRDELSQKLKIPVEKIMESIKALQEQALVYESIDEFHFKAT